MYLKSLTIAFLFTAFSYGSEDPSRFSSLLQYGLEKSPDSKSSQLETRHQEAGVRATSRLRSLPQISLSASYQTLKYDRLKDDGTGKFVSNDGNNTSFGISVSYDLQKLFGPEGALAALALDQAKIQEKIAKRDLVRTIKKSFFLISMIKSDISEINKVIANFSKIDAILQKQKNIGVNNEIERQQFNIQQSLFNNDLQTRQSDLDAAYSQLSTILDMPAMEIQNKIDKIKDRPQLVFSNRTITNASELTKLENKEIINNLGKDYNLSKLEYEKFSSTAMPTVFARVGRDSPTMFSSDGPQNITEIGISIPIDGFFTRSDQKAQLSARADRNRVQFEKSMSDYKNQIKLNFSNLARFKNQASALDQTLNETKKLMDKSFLYYSQKRLDVLGVMDVLQKYIQTSRNHLVNEWQIQSIDADLEYLVGGE